MNAILDDDVELEPEDVAVAAVSGSLTYDRSSVTGTLERVGGGTSRYALSTSTIDLYGPNAEIAEITSIGTATLSTGGVQQAGLFATVEQ